MATPTLLGHRKYQFYQANVTDETNTNAGATWTAGEVTLINDIKVKVNAILAALRSAGIIATTASNKTGSVWGGRAGRFLQTNIADEATANADITYDAAEETLINSLKGKVNSILTALNAAGFGGTARYVWTGYARPRQKTSFSLTQGQLTLTAAGGSYTSGASGEQQLINDLKTAVNNILAALRTAKVLS